MSFIVSNTYDIHATASLDLQFASKKNLIDQISGSNLVDFTRQGRATYVDGDGVIRTATTNLLLRSEEFDTTWVQPGIVSANTEIAPNGTLTADTITSGGGANSVYQNVSVLASTIYTASVYVKLGTMSSSDYKIAVYNNSAASFIAVDVTPSQTPNSSTWTRVIYTFTTPAGCTSVRWYPFRNSDVIASSTAFLWGAQVEQSTTVGEYIPTTSTINSAPRFDHNPTTGESLGLLVEEARTNILPYSEDFSQPAWVTFGTASKSSNVATAPDGNFTADSITIPAASGVYDNIAVSASTTYTFSVYIRGTPGTTIKILSNANSSGVVDNTVTVSGVWQRYSITFTTNSGDNNTSIQFDTGGGNTFYVWGVQVEAGAFPTSYIPTTGATATRAADVASISGSNFSSWYRQDEGTVFADATLNGIASQNYFCAFPSGTVFDNSHLLYAVNGATRGETFIATAIQATILLGLATTGQKQGIAYSYRVNDFAGARNGTLGTPDTSGSLPTPNRLTIGMAFNSGAQLNGTIRRLTYWPTRLPNETLQNITV